jgi:hypothetical protein
MVKAQELLGAEGERSVGAAFVVAELYLQDTRR